MGRLKGLILLIGIGGIVFGVCQSEPIEVPVITIPPKPQVVNCNKCKEIICCKRSKDKVCTLGYPAGCEKCNIRCDSLPSTPITTPPSTTMSQVPGEPIPGVTPTTSLPNTPIIIPTSTTMSQVPGEPIPGVPPISQPRNCKICKGFYCAPACVNINGGHACPDLAPPSPEIADFCRKCKEKGEVKCDGDKGQECKVDKDCIEKKHICLQPEIYPSIPYIPVCENGKCTCKPKHKEKPCPPYKLGFCGDECRPVCEDGKWLCRCIKPPIPPRKPRECDRCRPLYCVKNGKEIVTTPELAAFCRKCFEEGKIRCKPNHKEPMGIESE